MEDLKKKGAVFVDELKDIDDYSRPVIFSAHGVPKLVPNEAKKEHFDNLKKKLAYI